MGGLHLVKDVAVHFFLMSTPSLMLYLMALTMSLTKPILCLFIFAYIVQMLFFGKGIYARVVDLEFWSFIVRHHGWDLLAEASNS